MAISNKTTKLQIPIKQPSKHGNESNRKRADACPDLTEQSLCLRYALPDQFDQVGSQKIFGPTNCAARLSSDARMQVQATSTQTEIRSDVEERGGAYSNTQSQVQSKDEQASFAKCRTDPQRICNNTEMFEDTCSRAKVTHRSHLQDEDWKQYQLHFCKHTKYSIGAFGQEGPTTITVQHPSRLENSSNLLDLAFQANPHHYFEGTMPITTATGHDSASDLLHLGADPLPRHHVRPVPSPPSSSMPLTAQFPTLPASASSREAVRPPPAQYGVAITYELPTPHHFPVIRPLALRRLPTRQYPALWCSQPPPPPPPPPPPAPPPLLLLPHSWNSPVPTPPLAAPPPRTASAPPSARPARCCATPSRPRAAACST